MTTKKNEIFYLALDTLITLVKKGNILSQMFFENFEEGENPVLSQFDDKSHSFGFLQDRYEIACERLIKSPTDESLVEFGELIWGNYGGMEREENLY